MGQALKGGRAEVLMVPRWIVGSLSGKEALQSLEGEVVCLVGEEDLCWV